jgi:hypothetical protein
MAIQAVKKPVAAVAPAAKPAVAPPAMAVGAKAVAPVAEAPIAEGSDDAAEPKEPRKTRKDFATHEEFCDYKIDLAEKAVVKWTERVTLWKAKKLNKDADAKVKMEKKSEKLIASFIQTQINMGTDQKKIDQMVAAFRLAAGA